MLLKNNTTEKQPIIVVRRRGHGDGDGHHGGVWKIAYADFMTAMMAFFLVMWLINSTDEKTIVQVAAYFNPIRLSDKSPSDRGLHDGTQSPRDTKAKAGEADMTKGERSRDASNGEPAQDQTKPPNKRETRRRAEQERELFEEPQKTLEKIAESKSGQTASDLTTGPARSENVNADTTAVLDPFARRTPQQAMPREVQERTGQSGVAAQPKGPPPVEAKDREAAALQSIVAAIEQLAHVILGPKPRIEVTLVPEGVLISLSDAAEFGMFAVGSAEPRPEMVNLMTRIGRILSTTDWPIIVRGHTDARQYRSVNYDNWRLSSARAHMAHYMLVRGGVGERRILRVEGHADRMPKNEKDKEAAENRRIDVIIRKIAS